MKRLGIFFSPSGWATSPSQVTPKHFVRLSPKQFAGLHLYNWVEKGTVRVKCFAKEHNVGAPTRARTLDLQVPSPTHQPLSYQEIKAVSFGCGTFLKKTELET